METLKAFFREETYLPKEKEIAVSQRFCTDGKAAKWKIRALREAEMPLFPENADRNLALCAAAVREPDLNDKKLWESYGAASKEEVLQKMLTPGEYFRLLKAVLECNGFQERKLERKETAKN